MISGKNKYFYCLLWGRGGYILICLFGEGDG